MKSQDIPAMEKRIETFNKLNTRLSEINQIIDTLQAGDPLAPGGSGPFTGNARESRRVKYVSISLTATSGGASSPLKPTELHNPNIEAYGLSQFLISKMKEQKEAVVKAMEEL